MLTTESAAMIPAKDIESTRKFYEETLGHQVNQENPGGIQYKTGNSRFWLYPSEGAGTAQHTLIGFLADDIEAAVDDLTAKGVTFEHYDMEMLKTDAKGIADFGDAGKGAWFKDPEGNTLSVWQYGPE